MNTQQNDLIEEMIAYESGDPERIQHFLKVHAFAKLIGEREGLDDRTLKILETAAIVHDIGIKKAEEIYRSAAGCYQEELGPAEAEEMLTRLGYDAELIARVSFLVGHHHTYTGIQGADYQILVEADFLVNLYEEHAKRAVCVQTCEKIFRTETGKRILHRMFAV